MEGPLKPPYTKARHVVVASKKTGKKREYIVFYAWDPELCVKRRGRVNVPKHLDADPKEKRSWIKTYVENINELLESGNTFRRKKKTDPFPTKAWMKGSGLTEMLEALLVIRKASNRQRSWETYRNVVNSLFQFLRERELQNIKAQGFENRHAVAWSDWLMTSRKISPRTRNGYVANLKSLFSDLKTRGGIISNPFESIKMLRADQGLRHRPYSPEEKIKMFEWMEKNDPILKSVCLAVYSCGLRSTSELCRLRKRDVRLDERRLNIPASIAKNRKGETIPLYEHALRLFAEILPQIEKDDMYIFGSKQYGTEKPVGENNFPGRHSKALKALNLEGRNHTLYSWKHTGVIFAHKAGLDLISIQALCRHHSPEITVIYLRDLGLFATGAELKIEW